MIEHLTKQEYVALFFVMSVLIDSALTQDGPVSAVVIIDTWLLQVTEKTVANMIH